MRFNYERTYYGFLVTIVLLYPFSVKLCNAAILLLAGYWLAWLIARPKNFKWNNKRMWLLVAFYLLTAVSLVYSENFKVAIFELDKKMSLLVFPLVIGSSPPLKKSELNNLVVIAAATVFAAMCFCISAAVIRTMSGQTPGFFWKELTMPLHEYHPTYLSLYINFLIGWLLIHLIENWRILRTIKKILMFSLLMFFYLSLGLLSSKIHIVLGVVVPVVCAFCYFSKRTLQVGLPLFFLLLGILGLTLRNTKAAERFRHINTLSYRLDAPVKTFNEFTIRLAIAECSWKVLQKNMLFGVGIGDVYDELDKVYREVDYKFGYLDQQNPHNEFLSQWLATGIVGLALFVLILSLFFGYAMKQKQYDFFIFLILFTTTFLLESVLERQKGIVLFSLLANLYVFSQTYLPDRPRSITKKVGKAR